MSVSAARRALLVDCFVGVVALALVVMAGFRLTERRTIATGITRAPKIDDWRRAGVRLGAVQPLHTIVEFGDYQCAFCASSIPALDSLAREGVAVEYRHFPLSNHEHAFTAAVVAECAADQGRFEKMHRLLYQDQDSIGVRSWVEFARIAGMPDLKAFTHCIETQQTAARVSQDVADAEALGLKGTPAFYFEGKLLLGQATAPRIQTLVK